MIAALVLALPLSAQVQAQEAQTLADIRQELSVLYVEIQRLRTELSTTGAPQVDTSAGGALARIDAVEGELRRLTAQTETLQLRLEAVVADGTNRLGDLEFRLCELETTCDIAKLAEASTLGGSAPVAPPAVPSPEAPTQSVVVGEQGDFERAKAAFDAGDFATAAAALATFVQTYPGGPLSIEAHYLRGEALAAQSIWAEAARAYLEAFSGAPDGQRAPQALLKLGTSLAELGQRDDACLTLSEVPIRYPQAPAALEANSAAANLGCS